MEEVTKQIDELHEKIMNEELSFRDRFKSRDYKYYINSTRSLFKDRLERYYTASDKKKLLKSMQDAGTELGKLLSKTKMDWYEDDFHSLNKNKRRFAYLLWEDSTDTSYLIRFLRKQSDEKLAFVAGFIKTFDYNPD